MDGEQVRSLLEEALAAAREAAGEAGRGELGPGPARAHTAAEAACIRRSAGASRERRDGGRGAGAHA